MLKKGTNYVLSYAKQAQEHMVKMLANMSYLAKKDEQM